MRNALLLASLLATGAVPAGEPVPSASAIEVLLEQTAERRSALVADEGKGFSYRSYGSDELLYAVGDLDGDGRPEIAARLVYFMGVGSYDLVDIFTDRGNGYEQVDFINLYNVGLEDKVESLAIRNGLLHIETVGRERGKKVSRSGAFRWPLSEPNNSK